MKIAFGMLAFNHRRLSQRCIESILQQDIEIDPFVLNNGSSDDTADWLDSGSVEHFDSPKNLGISAGWNFMLDMFFPEYDFALIANNDTIMPPWFARELVAYNVPLVTGIDTSDMADILEPVSPHAPLVPYPDFSSYLIRRDTWKKVGRFNTDMFNYCSDCDLHVRAHRVGIDFWKATVRYYHERSSTINLASEQDQRWMNQRADLDREEFQKLYNCQPGTNEYLQLLGLL